MTDLQQRYGAPSAARTKAVVAVVALLVGLGLSWLVWVMLEHGRPLAQSDLTGFETVDAHTVSATFVVVRRDDDVKASCLLRAFAGDHAIVGEANVEVGPGGDTTSKHTETVRTERRATSVEMVGCTAPGQSRRR